MVALRAAADNCPACILAGLRQSGIQREWAERGDDGYEAPRVEFDFRAEVAKFWKERNAEGWASDIGAPY